MTYYSKLAIRLSLVYLLVGFTIGALMLASKGYSFFPWVYNLLPLHMEYLMFGWFIHLIFGTAYWMFPRFTPSKTNMEKPRGFVRAAWVSLGLLNVGLFVFTLSYFLDETFTVRFIARTIELLAVVAFLINLWPRTKPMSQPD